MQNYEKNMNEKIDVNVDPAQNTHNTDTLTKRARFYYVSLRPTDKTQSQKFIWYIKIHTHVVYMHSVYYYYYT